MLRTRSFFVFLAVMAFLAGASLLVVRYTLVDAMDRVERRLAEDVLRTIRTVVEAEMLKMVRTTRDWAFWSATYQFIEDLNTGYIEENLTAESFKSLHVHGMLFYNKDRVLRYQTRFDFSTGVETRFSEELLGKVQKTISLFSPQDEGDCISGIFVHEGKALLTAACPILDSDVTGPSRGTLVLVREMDQEIIDFLQATTNHTIAATADDLETDVSSAQPRSPEISLKFFKDQIVGRVVFPGLQSHGALIVETQMERSIHRQAVQSMRLFAAALAILALWSLGALWYFMDRKVLRRIGDIVLKTRKLPLVSENAAQASNLDEIGVLRQSMNELLRNLERAVEEKLEQQQELHTILETNPVGIVLVDQEKRTVSWANSKALELMGRSLDEVRNRSCKDVVCPARGPECPVLDLGREVRDVECLMPTSEGKGVPVLRSIVAVTYNRRPHLLEAVGDLRAQKALESQLDRAKKLETVGLVAGGVAHDLNNLLTSLVGYPDMLLGRMSAADPMYRPLTLIRDAGLKAGAIVQDLLTLARRGVKTTERFDLGQLMTRVFSSTEFAVLRSAHPDVRIVIQVESRHFYCLGSEPHLEKALMNLVRNAVEAIADTGTVTVAVDGVELDQPKSGFETVPAGRWIRLRIQDTGCGIAAEDLPHIFEPFYTKKKMGSRSGTGLGMTVIWHAVKDMGGFVDVESAPGHGTTFTLYLPEADPPAGDSRAEWTETLPKGSGQKILVVEDMEDQRILVEKLLTDLGYRVFTACTGREAVALALTQDFDALVLDMRLGDDMDGLDVYREILKHRPTQRVLVVSGDVSEERVAALTSLGVSHYLPKPYSLQKMAEAVHLVLQSPPGDLPQGAVQ